MEPEENATGTVMAWIAAAAMTVLGAIKLYGRVAHICAAFTAFLARRKEQRERKEKAEKDRAESREVQRSTSMFIEEHYQRCITVIEAIGDKVAAKLELVIKELEAKSDENTELKIKNVSVMGDCRQLRAENKRKDEEIGCLRSQNEHQANEITELQDLLSDARQDNEHQANELTRLQELLCQAERERQLPPNTGF